MIETHNKLWQKVVTLNGKKLKNVCFLFYFIVVVLISHVCQSIWKQNRRDATPLCGEESRCVYNCDNEHLKESNKCWIFKVSQARSIETFLLKLFELRKKTIEEYKINTPKQKTNI